MSHSDDESSTNSDDNDEEEDETTSSEDPLRLDPPSFSLPTSGDFQVWSIRMPKDMDISSLHGVELDLTNSILGHFKSKDDDDGEYGLVLGNATEVESFRWLLPSDKTKNMLVPSKVGFDRHMNIVHMSVLRDRLETDVAPRVETAPVPDCLVRYAYTSVPQRTNLKRRWSMPGSGSFSSDTTAKDHTTGSSPKRANHEREKLGLLSTPEMESPPGIESSPKSKRKSGKKEKKEKKSKSDRKVSKKERKERQQD